MITKRRPKNLSKLITKLIEDNSKILDVGCSDGRVSHELLKINKLSNIQGLEIRKTKKQLIKTRIFNGKKIPYPKNYFDYVLFIDVLHHTKNQEELLKEAKGVAKKGIIIKDVKFDNRSKIKEFLGKSILTIWDYLTNRKHNYPLKNYKKLKEWKALIKNFVMKIKI